jgi:type IV pilus assembly protein PilW
MKSCQGFTLIEILIALFVSSVGMVALTMYCLSQQKSTVISTNISDMQQGLRATVDFIGRDIRMAGFDPGSSGSFGIRDIAFHNHEGVAEAAGEGFLQIAWDADEDGALDPGEIISYSLASGSEVSPDSLALTRELGSGGGRQPLAGYIVNMEFAFAIDEDLDGDLDRDPANKNNVLWLVDTDSNGTWDKLDTDGDGHITVADNGGAVGTIAGTATGIPVSTKYIRAVRIWLLARSEARDPKYVDSHVYVVGRKIVQPNNPFRHRLLERIVLCRNMGLN